MWSNNISEAWNNQPNLSDATHTVTSIYNEPSIKIPVGCQVDFIFLKEWNMANISWRQRTMTTCPISSIQSYSLTRREVMLVFFFFETFQKVS